ncbi:hypothetical protein F4824DRAFT_445075 [Ustulina deusta]|nr:hypothetical protein F4824DRAFT_445075 [Ustulina deusta]
MTSEDEDICLHHNGSLRGVVDGIICEFTPQSNSSHLNTSDTWFPYIRYPFNFYWACCGATFGVPGCLRVSSPIPEPAGSLPANPSWSFFPSPETGA